MKQRRRLPDWRTRNERGRKRRPLLKQRGYVSRKKDLNKKKKNASQLRKLKELGSNKRQRPKDSGSKKKKD